MQQKMHQRQVCRFVRGVTLVHKVVCISRDCSDCHEKPNSLSALLVTAVLSGGQVSKVRLISSMEHLGPAVPHKPGEATRSDSSTTHI